MNLEDRVFALENLFSELQEKVNQIQKYIGYSGGEIIDPFANEESKQIFAESIIKAFRPEENQYMPKYE